MRTRTLAWAVATALAIGGVAGATTSGGNPAAKITYQGRLLQNGQPANGTFDMTFDLYDRRVGGNFIDSDDVLGVVVTDGLFTVRLDFDPWHFGTGDTNDTGRRWLEIEVNGTGLSPRQEVTRAPFALQTRGIFVDQQDVIRITRPTSDAAIELETGDPTFRTAIIKQELDGDFILQLPQLGAFRINQSTGTTALAFFEDGTWAVGIDAPDNVSFHIHSDHDTFKVSSVDGIPLIAETLNPTADIIDARSSDGTEFSVNGTEGVFRGNLTVFGQLSKGGGMFLIDHPLDPENKYLSHSFVESPDMMNIYNGNVVTDADGYATIELPEWFDALNRDYRYQLTVIDDSDDFILAKVVREVVDNTFVIRTSRPRAKVSWQVTGIRDDAYARMHPIPVEQPKPHGERGRYLHPEAFNQPASRRIGANAVTGSSSSAPDRKGEE